LGSSPLGRRGPDEAGTLRPMMFSLYGPERYWSSRPLEYCAGGLTKSSTFFRKISLYPEFYSYHELFTSIVKWLHYAKHIITISTNSISYARGKLAAAFAFFSPKEIARKA
jgi:hypothetical protein